MRPLPIVYSWPVAPSGIAPVSWSWNEDALSDKGLWRTGLQNVEQVCAVRFTELRPGDQASDIVVARLDQVQALTPEDSTGALYEFTVAFTTDTGEPIVTYVGLDAADGWHTIHGTMHAVGVWEPTSILELWAGDGHQTVMTYGRPHHASLQALDIEALQRTYGPSPGDDWIIGGHGTGAISGGTGHDTIYGNRGEDRLDGGAGNDLLFGGRDDDLLHGGAGRDLLAGDDGRDWLGGEGDGDGLTGGPGADTLYGNAGADILYGNQGDDWLFGGRDGDLLHGGASDDRLFGDDGDDTLAGDLGNDILYGGAGIDATELVGAAAEWLIRPLAEGEFEAINHVTGERDLLYGIETVILAGEERPIEEWSRLAG